MWGFRRLVRAWDYLEPDHETVQALGIPSEVAKALGIGWAKRGTMLERVLNPLRALMGVS
jgi:hypothetical protein